MKELIYFDPGEVSILLKAIKETRWTIQKWETTTFPGRGRGVAALWSIAPMVIKIGKSQYYDKCRQSVLLEKFFNKMHFISSLRECCITIAASRFLEESLKNVLCFIFWKKSFEWANPCLSSFDILGATSFWNWVCQLQKFSKISSARVNHFWTPIPN